MKILIIIGRDLHRSFLIRLHTEQLKREIRNLIIKGNNSLAMATALSKGRFEKEVACDEIYDIKADLLLSVDSVRWDLTRER